MTDTADIHSLVEGALIERGIRFERREDAVLRIPHGSAEVLIGIDDLAGGTVIRVSALVLDELELVTEDDSTALRALNDRNRTVRFAKFMLERDLGNITLEYDLLGDFLQPEELINAIAAIAGLADDHDELLRDELGGGRRAADR
jgi:hypothetical protein